MLGFSPYGFGAVTVKRAAGLLIDGVDIRVFGVSCQYRFVNIHIHIYMYTYAYTIIPPFIDLEPFSGIFHA